MSVADYGNLEDIPSPLYTLAAYDIGKYQTSDIFVEMLFRQKKIMTKQGHVLAHSYKNTIITVTEYL